MGKLKVKALSVDWTEKDGVLVGTVADTGVSTNTIIRELETIPVDTPTLKNRDAFTKEVHLVYPSRFAIERKQTILETVQDMYPNWKFEIPKDKKSLHMYPSFDSGYVF